jgi:hypothetical protein
MAEEFLRARRGRGSVSVWAATGEFSRRNEVAYRDLREFVRKLESEGELRRVKAEVDPVLEIAEVVQRLRREALRGEDAPEKKKQG